MNPTSPLIHHLHQTRSLIAEAERKHHRAPHSVQLLAVSKTQSAESIKALFDAGQCAFGENYWQEAQEKQLKLRGIPIEWHFIGQVQSRKARDIGQAFHWLHTVDRVEILPKLNLGAAEAKRVLQLCIQINISRETTKNGIDVAALMPLALAINDFPHLTLRGLMAIPEPILLPEGEAKSQQQRAAFAQMAALLQQLRNAPALKHHPLDTLSMGMSDDYPAAIAEGATLIRLGTALFGPRQKEQTGRIG